LENPDSLKEGYAPFCKHLFVENFTPTTPGHLLITKENRHAMMSDYKAREAIELPVLMRWLDLRQLPSLKKAKFLDIILYSKEQITSECLAQGLRDPDANEDYEYGIISVKPQDVDFELPMEPITILRNALGKEYGGSGERIDKDLYEKSVDFWSNHAVVK